MSSTRQAQQARGMCSSSPLHLSPVAAGERDAHQIATCSSPPEIPQVQSRLHPALSSPHCRGSENGADANNSTFLQEEFGWGTERPTSTSLDRVRQAQRFVQVDRMLGCATDPGAAQTGAPAGILLGKECPEEAGEADDPPRCSLRSQVPPLK